MGLKLSKKYGANPSLLYCKCCGRERGIALLGRIKGDQKAPPIIYDGLCDDCKKVVEQGGVMIIEVRDGEMGSENPYRTGRIVGITKEAKERIFKKVETPICFMEKSLFSSLFDASLVK